VVLDGWVADAAITIPIGPISPVAKKLLQSTRQSLFDAVEQVQVGNRLGDISQAVQARVEGDGFAVIRSLVGHGVGRDMHEDPQIPNFGTPKPNPVLEEGMVLAIEPMVNVGNPPDPDRGATSGRSTRRNGSLAAHFEFTVAVTKDGPRIPHTPWHEEEALREVLKAA